MSKNKNRNNKSLEKEPSQLGQFVERKLPSDNQVNRFDHYLKGGLDKSTINESLSEIYQDAYGKRVNVKHVDIKPKRGVWARIGLWTLVICFIAAIVAGAYYFILKRGSDTTAVDVEISSPEELIANEPFEYTVDYRNHESVALTNLELNLSYPENFIFESAFPSPNDGNNKWNLNDLRQFSSGQIKIKGRLIAPPGQPNLLFADLRYQPSGITSEFKKSTSLETVVTKSGMTVSTIAPTNALVGQDAELLVTFKPEEKSYIEDFVVRFGELENLEFPKADYGEGISSSEPGIFKITKIDTAEKEIRFKFKFKEKKNDTEELKVFFEIQPDGSSETYAFEEKTFPVEVVQNSLNLTLSANGQSSDQGINFGQTINYSISYVNKGQQTMNDVIVMAVLDGEAIDWRKLIDKNNGTVTGRTIVWTKTEIPELESIAKDQEGTIDFSIPVRSLNEAKLISGYEIKSYAQFAISGKSEDLSADNDSNRSNQMTIKVNSDTNLDEAVRYFDEDNIAVGTGPLPPRSGETSTFKVYWKLENTLHELAGLMVKTTLPDYVMWDGKEQADVGTLSYDSATHEVTWIIGRLPISATNAEAEFSTDNQTSYPISQTLKAQTTRLEKDDIADTDGIVQ